MSGRTKKLGVGVAALVLASLACNLITGGTQDEPSLDPNPPAVNPIETEEIGTDPEPSSTTPAPTPPAPLTEPAPQSEQIEGPGTIDLSDLTLFAEPPIETYLTNLVYTFEGVDASGQNISGSAIMEGVQGIDPRKSSMTFSTFGNAVVGNDDSFVFAQIGETSYLSASSSGCISGPNSDIDNPFDLFLETGGFLMGEANRVTPDEVINNVETYVYEITPENLNPDDPTSLDVVDVDGRLYIAKDGFYVVRLIMNGFGSSEVLSGDPNLVGDLYYELNFIESQEPIPISPPEECTTVDTGSFAHPILEDAYDIFSMGPEITTYETNTSFAEAVNFYETEMVANGWTYDQNASFITSPSAILSFSNADGKTVLILIGESSPGADSLSIVITES